MTLHRGTSYVDDQVSLRPPHPPTIRQAVHNADVADSVAHWLEAAEQYDEVHYFSVYWNEVLVGQLLLHDIDRSTRSSLIAYHLFESSYRSKGIGTKALTLLLHYVQEQTDLTQLVIITSRDNRASQRIAAKCGFAYAGASREDPVDGMVFVWNRPN